MLTKTDKIKREKLFDKCLAVGLQLMKFKNVEYLLHAVSSKDGFGIEHLKTSIVEAIQMYPTRNLQGKEEMLIKYLLENKTLKAKKRQNTKLPKFKKAKVAKLEDEKKAALLENENK